MSGRAPRILMAGGGTGGHAYPAIAIADAIRALEPMAVIEFAGTQDRIEWTAVPKAGYAIHPITVTGFNRQHLWRNLAFPFKLIQGLWQSWRLVGGFDADVVVGTGGFVAGPVLYAASLRGRPIVIQEQNAYAGMTNRILAGRATQIHIAFEAVRKDFPAGKCVLSGNPTRPEFQQVAQKRGEGKAHFGLPDEGRVLFVFGGSLGSVALNTVLEAHYEALLADPNTYLIWQTGRRYFERIEARIEVHPRLCLKPYIDRMDLAYAAADVVLCRAGASTCSELMVAQKPAILVPAPQLAEDHQTKNARSMADQGAAVLLPEAELQTRLIAEVEALLQDPARQEKMVTAMKTLARPDAARDIAQAVLSLIPKAN